MQRSQSFILASMFFVLTFVSGTWVCGAGQEMEEMDLTGPWAFQVDRHDKGIAEKWFAKDLQDTILLPGSMPEQKKGFPVGYDTEFTGSTWKKYPAGETWVDDESYKPYLSEDEFRYPFWLISDYHYVGAAWYQKDVTVPESWAGKPVELFLERPHWETQVWINGERVGMHNGLGVPHRYDVGKFLKPGVNKITLRIDNRVKIGVGVDAHSVSDNTQGNWNGMVGAIKLVRKGPVFVSNVKIFPDVEKKSARLGIVVENTSGGVLEGMLNISAQTMYSTDPHVVTPIQAAFKSRPGSQTVVVEYPMGERVQLWDEFNPEVYQLTVQLDSGKARDVWAGRFGMREIKRVGNRFEINGRPVFLRGTLECCIFPETGYPPTDIEAWERIIKICKAHGLNHIRFHSWCPPAAAFEAADKLGFYYQVEASAWAGNLGAGEPIDPWIYDESERMVAEYGNHPSFCLMPYGNEPHGENHKAYLTEFVKYWKSKDTRRVYTTGAGWPIIAENDFHNIYHGARIQGWNQNLNSVINKEAPRSDYDWGKATEKVTAPIVSHEIGQWCVYPNFEEIPKYDGVMKATNFKIFRDSLEARGLLHLSDEYVKASGKLQALCYKADIEAALRTEGFGGFQLLDLRDFPGQGTALVGILDPFWDEKGYITPEAFSQFCNETVPLARFRKMIFTSDESVACDIEVAHYGGQELNAVVPSWKVVDADGKTVRKGTLSKTDLPWGHNQKLGSISEKFDVKRATQFQLQVEVAEFMNSWDFWVYPAQLPAVGKEILVVSALNDEALAHLRKGGKVLLTVKKGSIKKGKGGEVAVGFSSIFWNTAWTNGQKPHTLGILCNPGHPALTAFPSEYHSNWQWWDAMSHCNAISLEDLKNKPEPIVRIIDDWVTNRNLAMIFEAKVGNGKLIMAGVDLQSDLERRPEARQLLFSLKSYMESDLFVPETGVGVDEIHSLFKTPGELARSGAAAVADSFEKGYEAANVLDGNPDTIWHAAWKRETPDYPYTVQINLAEPVELKGFTLLPRQDGNRNGLIAEYEIYLSNDAEEKGSPVAKGTLSEDGTPKTIELDQPVAGQYITLIATSGFSGGKLASLAEFGLITK